MDTVSPEKRSEIMSKVKSFGSKLETRVKELLADLGICHVYQPKMTGRPDFFLPAFNVALFADSCFWHFCPEHGKIPKTRAEWWKAKLERNRDRDAETTAGLEAEGFKVVRIWEHDLKTIQASKLLDLLREAKSKLATMRFDKRPEA